jgi:glycosyltransferase involved in cell wall biosynthesis
MLKNPIVSVVIPTYNRECTILRSIYSVLRQDYKNIEIIIIDDCSNDNTLEVINTINDSRLRVIPLKNNCGPSHARNIGINASNGEFLAFLDSDDEWLPFFIRESLSVINKASSAATYTKYQINDGEIFPRYKELANFNSSTDKLTFLLFGNIIALPTLMFRRSVLVNFNGFDESLSAYEDYDLLLRVLHSGKNIAFLDKVALIVHRTEGGVNSNNKNIFTSLNRIREKNSLIIENNKHLTYFWNKNSLIYAVKSSSRIDLGSLLNLILSRYFYIDLFLIVRNFFYENK